MFFVTLLQWTRAPHNGLWRRRDAGLLLWRQSSSREFFKLKGAWREKFSGRWRTNYHHPCTAHTSSQDLLLPHTIKLCYCVTGYWYVTKHEGTDLNEQEGSCLDTCVCVCVCVMCSAGCDIYTLLCPRQVREILGQCSCPAQFPMIKVSEGKYKVGDSSALIFIRVRLHHHKHRDLLL